MIKFSLLTASVLFFTISVKAQDTKKWVSLFNGKDLSGWDSYLGIPLDSAGKKLADKPIGPNYDPQHVFSVAKQDNVSVIRISGVVIGGISSKEEFENYHLQLKFKWGNLLQKYRDIKDSGLLYHSVGENAADSGAWMRSHEFQIQEGDCGDYYGCGGAFADVPTINGIYNPAGTLLTYSATSPQGRHVIRSVNAEKPAGEWNTIDLYCLGDTSVHMVNGKIVMVLYHNSQQDKDRTSPLSKGKIQLQSEGAEIFYKDIKLQFIAKLPDGLVK